MWSGVATMLRAASAPSCRTAVINPFTASSGRSAEACPAPLTGPVT